MISTIISQQKNNIRINNIISRIKTFITMTTIPERLNDKWFLNNLQRTISILRLNEKLRLHVPSRSTKDNVPYIVSEELKKLESTHFEICNVNQDEGPITKLLPALRDSCITDTDIIIVCDDDIVYNKNIFQLLKKSVWNNPNKISCMCNNKIEGYKGFAFIKKILKDLANINIPKSCERIDDDVIQEFARFKGIETIYISCGIDSSWKCSFNKSQTDTHPSWSELNNDNRIYLKNKCLNNLHFK